MAYQDSPNAVKALVALEANVQHDQAEHQEFQLCENGIRLAFDQICNRTTLDFPLNVAVHPDPTIPTFPRAAVAGSHFLTFSRMEAQFVERPDPRTPSGRRVLVVTYHYL